MEPVEPSDFIDPVEPTEAQLVSTAVTLVASANRTAPRPVPRETPMTPRPARLARPITRRTAPRPERCSSRPVVRVPLVRRDGGAAGASRVFIVRSCHIASPVVFSS
jgi:hypothetical protein